MQKFPHHYHVRAATSDVGTIQLTSPGLSALATDAPAEFGGGGDQWSPETMLVGAVASCFILTFKSVASAARLPWIHLACEGRGTLERIDRITRFTRIDLHARLEIAEQTDAERARVALERAEELCLISSSLNADCRLTADVVVPSLASATDAGGQLHLS
jgi:organic hydroperoxide reductase OsmC/OhrA